MECLAYSIAQIGPNQLGKLEVPGIFPITKWDNYEIVAVESGDTVACRKATVSIERKTETAAKKMNPIQPRRFSDLPMTLGNMRENGHTPSLGAA